jgi:hypothetical protein
MKGLFRQNAREIGRIVDKWRKVCTAELESQPLKIRPKIADWLPGSMQKLALL